MKKLFLLISIFVGLIVTSCDDYQLLSSDSLPVFSRDTLTFDTVFTSIGSATAKILVYNRQSKPVTIDKIQLAGGSASFFRINVDGSKNKEHLFESVTIRGKDSLYLFVEVTVNPQLSESPVLVRDSIVFTMDGARKHVLLEAFGQDMKLLRSVTITNDTILEAGLPYLIYGDLVVDSTATLKLAPGVRLYFHNNSNLMVYGNLIAEGSREQPVVMRGDRLDKIGFVTPVPYNIVAGQWGGVYLLNPHGNHLLRHVTINSGYVGVYYVNEDRNHKPFLEIADCRIHNFQFYNLVAINGDLLVSNSSITNSGGYTVYLNGGKHEFYHSTIANYFSASESQSVARDKAPAFMLMNLPRSFKMETIIANCIITGSSQNEISLVTRRDSLYKAAISYSYLRRSTASDLPQFKNIRWWQATDTVFVSIREDLEEGFEFDFYPDSISPVIGIANPEIARRFPIDLNGNNRLIDGAPDAGAFEWSSR